MDDDEQARSMVDHVLKKLWPDVETAEASDGFQAVQIAEEFVPDILVLDLMLPGQDGFAVLQALKNTPKLKSSLVLGMTAYNSSENILRLVKAGAISCLTKPFGPSDLKKWLSPYLGGDYVEEMFSGRKIEKGGGLLNLSTFLGLMISIFQPSNDVQAVAHQLTNRARIEEKYGKGEVPFKRIAILPFESSNLYIAGKSFSDTLVEHLTKKIRNLTIVERSDIEKVLSEQKFSLTGVVKQEKSKGAGDIEEVDALVMGTVRTMEYFGDDGGSIVVTVKIVDVNNGQILWSHKQEARCYSIGIDKKALAEELMNRAAKKITKQMKSHLSSLDRDSN